MGSPYVLGQELGVDGIVLSPVVDQMPHGYHGYWTKDLTKVNPAYGTEDSHWNWRIFSRFCPIKNVESSHRNPC